MKIQTNFLYPFILLLLISAVITLLWPGLHGAFMLDDWGNLPALYESIKGYGFWYGVFNGGSGPLGRPVSLLSFALQQHHWQEAFPFKLVNLILHIANGLLVIFLVNRLSPYFFDVPGRYRIYWSTAVGLVWLMLPVQISTVHYVIQRMVLLSALFSLLCMVGYLLGRDQLIKGYIKTGFGIVFCSLGVFGLLGILSKENALLVFVFILCIEGILSSEEPLKWWHKRILLFVLWIPVILFVSYLAAGFEEKIIKGYESRPFTLSERLLTQAVIIWDYFRQILAPVPSFLGLYHDAYPTYTSWLEQSAKPLLSILTLLLSVLLAVGAKIKRIWALFFCITWFLCGHLMESTVIPLELYFEHRNYLPSMSIVVGIFSLFIYLFKHLTTRHAKCAIAGLGTLYLASLFWITHQQSTLWGSPDRFQFIHAAERPESIRARSLLIDFYLRNQQVGKAYEALIAIKKDFPHYISPMLIEIEFYCANDKLFELPRMQSLKDRIDRGNFSLATLKAMNDLVELKRVGGCPSVSRDYLGQIIVYLKDSHHFKPRQSDFIAMLAYLDLQEGNHQRAIKHLLSIERRNYEIAVLLSSILAAEGYYQQALDELKAVRKANASSMRSLAIADEIKRLQATIEDDVGSSVKP